MNAAGAGVSFTGPVLLAAGGGTIRLTGSNGANNVSFGSTVDGAQALNLTSGVNSVSFGGVVGGGTALASVTVIAGAAIGTKAVTTSGAQSYTAATGTTLGGTLTVNTAGAGVSFAGGASGRGRRDDNADGDERRQYGEFRCEFDGERCAGAGDNGGRRSGELWGDRGRDDAFVERRGERERDDEHVGGDDERGAELHGDDGHDPGRDLDGEHGGGGSVLRRAGALGRGRRDDNADGTSAGNAVSFAASSTVNGAQALAIAAGGGAVSFGATVGGTTPLSSVTVNASGTTNMSAVTTSGAQSYTATTGTTLGGTLTVNTAGAGVLHRAGASGRGRRDDNADGVERSEQCELRFDGRRRPGFESDDRRELGQLRRGGGRRDGAGERDRERYDGYRHDGDNDDGDTDV